MAIAPWGFLYGMLNDVIAMQDIKEFLLVVPNIAFLEYQLISGVLKSVVDNLRPWSTVACRHSKMLSSSFASVPWLWKTRDEEFWPSSGRHHLHCPYI